MTSWEIYCDTQDPAAQVVWLAESLTTDYPAWPASGTPTAWRPASPDLGIPAPQVLPATTARRLIRPATAGGDRKNWG
jgi:hypothetical protein